MITKTYNGWANYETWNVALWFGNTENLYRDYMSRRPFTPETAERLARGWFPNGTPDFDNECDYIKVDWQEIADTWNED